MLERSLTALSSLKKIAETTQKGPYTASVMGVIIDATRPLFRERDKDYITELKIVDELVNQFNVYGILVKYCSVYIFSSDKQSLEVCNEVGQIVYLNSFTFSMWNDIKLQTKYRSTIQKLYTFNVTEGKLGVFNQLIASAQTQEAPAEQIQFRAQKLKIWFNEYFYDRYKPSLGIHLINNYCVMAEPFNMILRRTKQKIEEVHQLERSIDNHLTLQDSNNNTYILNKDHLPSILPHSPYVLVRGVKFIGNFYEINLTETGYLLGLPRQYEEQYTKEMNYCAISRFNERFLLKNHKRCNLSKINYVSPKTTPIIQLLNSIDVYQNKGSQSEELRVEDLYMIEAVVINFQGRLLMFNSEYQMIADEEYINNLTDDEKTELIQKGILQYLYEGVLGVLDRSSEGQGKLLYVHLFSNQERARFFDYQIIEKLNRKAGLEVNYQLEKQVKSRIQQKLQNLIDQSDFTNTVSMLLEPIKSDVLIYRLTNTVFI